jgi:hypothetical protein
METNLPFSRTLANSLLPDILAAAVKPQTSHRRLLDILDVAQVRGVDPEATYELVRQQKRAIGINLPDLKDLRADPDGMFTY